MPRPFKLVHLEAQQEIVGWQPNLDQTFSLFCQIRLGTVLFALDRAGQPFDARESIAFLATTLFVPFTRQHPGRGLKAKQITTLIAWRLDLWDQGNIDALVKEGHIYQAIEPKTRHVSTVAVDAAAMERLVCDGKLGAARALLSPKAGGILPPTEHVRELLGRLHPCNRAPLPAEGFIAGTPAPFAAPGLFQAIDADTVARRISGSGGYTHVDAVSSSVLCSALAEIPSACVKLWA